MLPMKLDENLRLYEDALRTMADMFFILDESDRHVFIHAAKAEDLYAPREKLLGQPCHATLPPEIAERFNEALAESHAGRSAQIEYCLALADGLKWFSAKISPILDEGRYRGAVVVVRDILNDSRELHGAVLGAMADMVFVFDKADRYIYVHAAQADDLFLPQDQLLGQPYHNLLPTAVSTRFDEALRQCRNAQVAQLEYCLPYPDGGSRWFAARISPIWDQGHYQGAVAVVRNIDEHRRALDELSMAGIVFESAMEGICICATSGVIRMANPAFSAITGYANEEVVGQTLGFLRCDRHDEAFYDEIWASLRREGRWQGEIWSNRKNGDAYPDFLEARTVLDKDRQPIYHVGVFSDLSEIRRRDELIHHQTYHDLLTGLPNRSLLEDRLTATIHQHERKRDKFAVAMLNIDNFGQINSSLGLAAGDRLLCQVAARLKACLGEDDLLARMGADRFALLLLPVGIASAGGLQAVIKRLRQCFESPFVCDGHEIFVSASLGLAVFPDDGRDGQVLIKHADMAVQQARAKGHGAYRFYSDDLNARITKRFELETELHHALAENQFELNYQPVVAASDGRIAGAEALIRWRHPQRGLIPPGDFIPLAEENGLITEITARVIQQVLEDQPRLGDIRVLVNIAAADLAESRIERLLEELAPNRNLDFLTLEFTENTLIDNRDEVLETMARLKWRGIRFAIDDFGTGYSSLSYLKRFPLDRLKIDHSFVSDLPHDEDSVGIARAIISLAQSLNLALIAEGVENETQLDFVRNEGCDFIQGFYFSRPLPLESFLELPRLFSLPA